MKVTEINKEKEINFNIEKGDVIKAKLPIGEFIYLLVIEEVDEANTFEVMDLDDCEVNTYMEFAEMLNFRVYGVYKNKDIEIIL